MPATLPASKADTTLDEVVLGTDGERARVPQFALIETAALDPRALVLSPLVLSALVCAAVLLGRVVSVAPGHPDLTMLVSPSEPLTAPATGKPVVLSNLRGPASDSGARRTALKHEPALPGPVNRITPSLEKPAAPRRLKADTTPPTALPPPPIPKARELTPARANQHIDAAVQAAKSPAPNQPVIGEKPSSMPDSLGGMPLTELLDNQDGLAAGLAALPWSQRLNLPRVSIRVNAEWVDALPKTQERLYFSIDPPQPDREVLAYLAASHDFVLERPAHPLWQIHEGERVPALAALRASAAHLLGVSPELVGLYTWHPPVLEDALQMFVLERMQELRVHLGPRDIVTVRLAASASGMLMNLEPVRPEM